MAVSLRSELFVHTCRLFSKLSRCNTVVVGIVDGVGIAIGVGATVGIDVGVGVGKAVGAGVGVAVGAGVGKIVPEPLLVAASLRGFWSCQSRGVMLINDQ